MFETQIWSVFDGANYNVLAVLSRQNTCVHWDQTLGLFCWVASLKSAMRLQIRLAMAHLVEVF